MFKRVLFVFGLLILSTLALAQEISIKGYFLEDSIKIGIGSPYVLTAEYPRGTDVLFPDSLYDYSPYELGEKWFATTKSTQELSLDSAIYYILSFEIDSTQYFSLPVYQLVGNDSVKIEAKRDSIFLTHLVTEIPDSIAAEAMPLVENTTYRYVELALNYPYLILGFIIFLIALIVVYVIFGKSIKKWFVLRKLQKRYDKFTIEYTSKSAVINDKSALEKLIYMWKKYLEELEKRPYTKMTTKELVRVEPFDRIQDLLKNLDKALYGRYENPDHSVFEEIKVHTRNRFEDKINEVKHG